MRRHITFIAVIVLLAANVVIFPFSASAQPRTWSGQVVDVRTGQPIQDVQVKAGTYGRVDAFKGYMAVTGPDGRFSITWPEETWKLSKAGEINHYLRVIAPSERVQGSGFWNATVIRRSPDQVVVRLMPRPVFVKGRVLSAENNQPMEKARVNLGIRKPGDTNPRFGIKAGVNTDAEGNFSLKPISGFPTDNAGSPPMWYDVEKGLQPRTGGEDYSKLLQDYGPMWDFAVGVGGIWYPISPDRIVTSVDEQIHTYVVIRHQAKDKPPHPNPITAELRGLQGMQPDAPTKTTPTPPPATAQGDGVFGIWESNWGMITIAGTNERITGYWDQGPKQRGQITGGNFDPATRRLYFTYYQDWSKTRGSATLTLSADGTVLSGPWKHESGGGGTWTIKLKERRPPDSTPEKPTRDQPGPAEPSRVAAFTVEAGKRNLSQGGSVTVPVSLNNVDGLANMNINVHYDPAVVRPARNAARGNLIPQSLFEANVRDRGVIRLGFAQRDDIRGTGTLAQIPFEAVGRPGTRTPLRLEVTTASTAAGSRVAPAQLIHGEITITGKDGRLPGDTTGTGTLTALDAMNALKMSVGNLATDMVADIDRDGSVTARDATLILQQVVGR